jgi:hypothetical protein
MFWVRFMFLAFYKLLKENDSFKMKNAKFGRKHTLRRPRWCGYEPNQWND